jgi:hypothetical protein
MKRSIAGPSGSNSDIDDCGLQEDQNSCGKQEYLARSTERFERKEVVTSRSVRSIINQVKERERGRERKTSSRTKTGHSLLPGTKYQMITMIAVARIVHSMTVNALPVRSF